MRSIDSVKYIDRCFATWALLALLMSGCASPTQRTDREAQRAGLTRSIVQGTAFRHLIYMRVNGPVETLSVYLEGDGLPWIGGRVPATDPTSRDPLALQLMAESAGPAMYVGRPCYYELEDSGCSTSSWTFARYSAATVESTAKAIESQARTIGAREVRLIGYSGGGVLAVLIAERLQNVSTVVTIAANLDIDAWTAHHGYLPLNESLNPARSTRTHPWPEIHLQGALDKSVPPSTTRAYFERFKTAKRIELENYDHVCCWREDWARIRERITAEIEKS